MNKQISNGTFKEDLIKLIESNEDQIFRNDTKTTSALRMKGLQLVKELPIPTRRTEDWKHTDIKSALDRSYFNFLDQQETNKKIDQIFACEVHNFDTEQVSLLNGWYLSSQEPLKKYDNGVVTGSIAAAKHEYPELIDKHFGKYADPEKNIFHALNAAMAQDGVFIYVPDNVKVEKPIQIISIINHAESIMLHTRNLIIMGKKSNMKLVHCDDSTNHQPSFNNTITEVFMDEGANLDHYKLQNLNNETTLLNGTYFHQEASSNLSTNAISLNGGLIRNYTHVKLNGRMSHADIFGVYLMDQEQHIDNQVFVHHAVPDCTSNEMFKGIMDDKATAAFNGHILVDRDAQRTNAFQNNRNMLLTDTASANSKPFLEIYADDVKCSHGATVGQLDHEAMFYLKTRGLCEATARLLLMYAFAGEVINKINIEPLQERIDDMVKKRLRGELSICENCVLHCSSPEKEIEFDIDLSKI
jgi:Fe-S cluster assembly protein SufD